MASQKHVTLKDEKQHDTADKSTSKQQVCISDGSHLHCVACTVTF